MKPEELKKVLADHKLWLKGEGGKRADLQHANLQYTDFRGSNLHGAKLQHTDLKGADLHGTNLRYANLQHANLYGTDLQHTDLQGADLRGANLHGADLRGANLRRAFVSMYCKWICSIVDGRIKIGCITKLPEEWERWLESDEEYETPRETDEFKQIEAVIRAHIAYLKVLNK